MTQNGIAPCKMKSSQNNTFRFAVHSRGEDRITFLEISGKRCVESIYFQASCGNPESPGSDRLDFAAICAKRHDCTRRVERVPISRLGHENICLSARSRHKCPRARSFAAALIDLFKDKVMRGESQEQLNGNDAPLCHLARSARLWIA